MTFHSENVCETFMSVSYYYTKQSSAKSADMCTDYHHVITLTGNIIALLFQIKTDVGLEAYVCGT